MYIPDHPSSPTWNFLSLFSSSSTRRRATLPQLLLTATQASGHMQTLYDENMGIVPGMSCPYDVSAPPDCDQRVLDIFLAICNPQITSKHAQPEKKSWLIYWSFRSSGRHYFRVFQVARDPITKQYANWGPSTLNATSFNETVSGVFKTIKIGTFNHRERTKWEHAAQETGIPRYDFERRFDSQTWIAALLGHCVEASLMTPLYRDNVLRLASRGAC